MDVKNKPIRILVVDDSLVCRELLSDILSQAPDLSVVGTAASGKEAIAKNQTLQPDLITMDVQMPGMDGFATIEEIMGSHPVPILVVTSSPGQEGGDQTMRALAAGALDLVEKPELRGKLAGTLVERIRVLATIRVAPRAGKKLLLEKRGGSTPAGAVRPLVAIASSTGGPKVLVELLGGLPRNYPACILVVQHIPQGFSCSLASWLEREIAMDVHEARENDPLRPGRVLIAPTGRHLVVRSTSLATLTDEPPIGGHRPSGTRLFRSLAQVRGQSAVGIVLSGMGDDGAEGLLQLRRAGGLCLAQNEESSLVFGMPKAAIDAGAVHHVFDVAGIQGFLLRGGSP